MLPDWLEPELTLNGNLDENYSYLHQVFMRDLSNLDGIIVDGKSVFIDMGKDKTMPQYERSFLHFVTRTCGDIRAIDFKRACKLHWVRKVLEHYTMPEVTAFWHMGPKGPVLYLWLEDHDFLLILKDQKSRAYKESRIMVTAYNVDPEYRRVLNNRLRSAMKVLQ